MDKMKFLLVVFILLGLTTVSCSSTTDSGSDLLNQAMTPAAKPSSPKSATKPVDTNTTVIAALQESPAKIPNIQVNKLDASAIVALQKLPVKTPKSKVRVWRVLLSDKVISNTLERWAEQGGYQLVWKSNHDFEITSSAVITGTIKESFNQVLLSFIDSNSPIKATWYKNKVIVITSFNE